MGGKVAAGVGVVDMTHDEWRRKFVPYGRATAQIWFCARQELGWVRYYWGRLTGKIVEVGLHPDDGGYVCSREMLMRAPP